MAPPSYIIDPRALSLNTIPDFFFLFRSQIKPHLLTLSRMVGPTKKRKSELTPPSNSFGDFQFLEEFSDFDETLSPTPLSSSLTVSEGWDLKELAYFMGFEHAYLEVFEEEEEDDGGKGDDEGGGGGKSDNGGGDNDSDNNGACDKEPPA